VSTGATTILDRSTALIRFQHTPVNTLAFAMRSVVYAELRDALRDERVKAVVLMGEGRGFCAGAQITEFASGEIALEPTAHDLWAMIEAAPKPVIAAIHGYALGGGLEFAMACHYRVAHREALLAAPEVRLGLLPGAGGTQRLPRAVGVDRALQMMLKGDRCQAIEFGELPLVDRFATGDVLEIALPYARELGARGYGVFDSPLPRLRDQPVFCRDAAAFFAAQREQAALTWPGMLAPPAIIDCVEASVRLGFEDGLRFEREKFQELVNNEQSLALRAAFFAERRAPRK